MTTFSLNVLDGASGVDFKGTNGSLLLTWVTKVGLFTSTRFGCSNKISSRPVNISEKDLGLTVWSTAPPDMSWSVGHPWASSVDDLRRKRGGGVTSFLEQRENRIELITGKSYGGYVHH